MKGLSLAKQVLVCVTTIPLLACQSGHDLRRNQSELPGKDIVDLRITEEPYYQQQKMDKKMDALVSYLEQQTGLNIEYVPSINYAHSHHLLLSGEVDLLWAGSLGALKMMSGPDPAQPIAVESKSFANVLLANNRVLPEIQSQLNSPMPLQSLKGHGVIFGARSSGSSFFTPVLEMQREGVSLNDLSRCIHESHHEKRALILADSEAYSFAWLPGSVKDPMKFVPQQVQSKLRVVWTSPVKRNYFILAGPHLPAIEERADTYQVQQALLALGKRAEDGQALLNQLGVYGFEQPDQAQGRLRQDSGRWLAREELVQLADELNRNPVCGAQDAG